MRILFLSLRCTLLVDSPNYWRFMSEGGCLLCWKAGWSQVSPKTVQTPATLYCNLRAVSTTKRGWPLDTNIKSIFSTLSKPLKFGFLFACMVKHFKSTPHWPHTCDYSCVLVNSALNSTHVQTRTRYKKIELHAATARTLLSCMTFKMSKWKTEAYFQLKTVQYKRTIGNGKRHKQHHIPHVNKHKHTSARFTMKHASDTRKKPAFTWFWGAVRSVTHSLYVQTFSLLPLHVLLDSMGKS